MQHVQMLLRQDRVDELAAGDGEDEEGGGDLIGELLTSKLITRSNRDRVDAVYQGDIMRMSSNGARDAHSTALAAT